MLNQADRNRLDAFQAHALRQIYAIPHSMVSHISNAEVRRISNQTTLSTQLMCRQLINLGRIASLPDASCVRQSVFRSSSHSLVGYEGTRKRGRPRLLWASFQMAKACEVAAGEQLTFKMMCPQHAASLTGWKAAVKRHFASSA